MPCDKIDFTFGIITAGDNEENINKIIDSVMAQNMPCFEIVIIGSCKINRKNVLVKEFDENQKKGWITRKKNIVTYYSILENIVYLHDYILFQEPKISDEEAKNLSNEEALQAREEGLLGWYQGFLRFGNDWNICSNVQVDSTNSRWIDHSLWWEDCKEYPNSEKNRLFLLPYDVTDLSKYQYVGGQYYILKKVAAKKYLLDENLVHCEGEDVEFSLRARQEFQFDFNPYSKVAYNKVKGNPFDHATPELIQFLRDKSVKKANN